MQKTYFNAFIEGINTKETVNSNPVAIFKVVQMFRLMEAN